MANRTIQFRGYGLGSNPVSATATYNGSQVFSGPITTVQDPIIPDPTNFDTVPIMFTVEVTTDFSGNVPMTVTVSGGNATLCQVWANYANVPDYSGNTVTFSSSGPTGFVNVYDPFPRDNTTITDARANMSIDGVPQTVTPEQRDGLNGTWWWPLGDGSTASYTLQVSAGLE